MMTKLLLMDTLLHKSACFKEELLGVCAAFLRRRATQKSSKGLEDAVHDGSYNCQPFFHSPNRNLGFIY